MIKLYSYFRSSASYRVRIALHYKGLPFQTLPVHLLKEGGEQKKTEYLRLNPQGLVPYLIDGKYGISQSLAILEYLEEAYPHPALLPQQAADRAYVRSIAQTIACEIHPLNNLRVLDYLKNILGVDEEAKKQWYHHWCKTGLQALESQLQQMGKADIFCLGQTPTLADVCLVPQWFNAQRFEVDLTAFPKLAEIVSHCLALESFARAAPAVQPDAST